MVDSDAVLPPGKLPAPLLKHLINRYVKPHPSVLVGPGIGRDAAAIAVGDRVIVVKTDPITFATSDAGRYLVNVNANDIACMGAIPRWLLVTALLPERATTPRLVEEMFASLAKAANELDIALVGGHSEITLGIDRPILIGQMIGETTPDALLHPDQARAGDAILLTGGIAIEGTAILAVEASKRLRDLPTEVVERASRLLEHPGISVIPAVRSLQAAGIRPHYLHDPTEGGLATALVETAEATGRGFEVEADNITILPETAMICATLGLNPLGLIASGAVLAVINHSDEAAALRSLDDAGILASRIGSVCDAEDGQWIIRAGIREPLPAFPVDEIARFFSQM